MSRTPDAATELLHSFLNPAQVKTLENARYVDVTGNETNRRYTVQAHRGMYNVEWPSDSLCFVPENADDLPRDAVLLIQLLALRVAEDTVLEVAN